MAKAPKKPGKKAVKKAAKTSQRVRCFIDFSVDIGSPNDRDARAEALRLVAGSLGQLRQAAHKILDDSRPEDIQERAHAYWLGRLDDILDPFAEDGMDGIYGTINELEGNEDDC